MLDYVEIKNFRSCEDVRFKLDDPVVALLGKNGAGKTNILHAVQLVAELCSGDSESTFNVHSRDPLKPASFVLAFTLNASQFIYRTSRSKFPTNPEVFEESLEKDKDTLFRRSGEVVDAPTSGLPSGFRIGTRSATLSALIQILPESHVATSQLRPISEYLRSIRYYPLLQGFQEHLAGPSLRALSGELGGDYSPFIEISKYEIWKAELAQGRARRSVQMRLLHLHLADKERFDELKVLLGENGLGLLADIRVEEVRLRNKALFEKSDDVVEPTTFAVSFIPGSGLAGAGQLFRYSGLSAGTWRILQLLTYLIFDQNSCMLLEQPEDSVHPGLLAKVIDILKTYSGRTQLVCTTHSPRVMNLIGPRGIRFVTARQGRTSVAELSEQDLIAAKSYLEDEGTLAEFLETL